MASTRPVTVYEPDDQGGRRVRVDGAILGRAYSTRDVAALLQQVGLQSWDELDVVRTDLIQWRGGGPDVWEPADTPGPPGPA
ncbi:hypothetical protein [Streptomyces alfalfae]